MSSLMGTCPTGVYVLEGSRFKGLVVPYQARYQHDFLYTKLVTSGLVVPPHITEKTPLYEVAGHMLSTRIYNLPVFDEKKRVIGPVHV